MKRIISLMLVLLYALPVGAIEQPAAQGNKKTALSKSHILQGILCLVLGSGLAAFTEHGYQYKDKLTKQYNDDVASLKQKTALCDETIALNKAHIAYNNNMNRLSKVITCCHALAAACFIATGWHSAKIIQPQEEIKKA